MSIVLNYFSPFSNDVQRDSVHLFLEPQIDWCGRRPRSIRTETSRHTNRSFPSAVGLINRARVPRWPTRSAQFPAGHSPAGSFILHKYTFHIHSRHMCLLLSVCLCTSFLFYILLYFILNMFVCLALCVFVLLSNTCTTRHDKVPHT